MFRAFGPWAYPGLFHTADDEYFGDVLSDGVFAPIGRHRRHPEDLYGDAAAFCVPPAGVYNVRPATDRDPYLPRPYAVIPKQPRPAASRLHPHRVPALPVAEPAYGIPRHVPTPAGYHFAEAPFPHAYAPTPRARAARAMHPAHWSAYGPDSDYFGVDDDLQTRTREEASRISTRDQRLPPAGAHQPQPHKQPPQPQSMPPGQDQWQQPSVPDAAGSDGEENEAAVPGPMLLYDPFTGLYFRTADTHAGSRRRQQEQPQQSQQAATHAASKFEEQPASQQEPADPHIAATATATPTDSRGSGLAPTRITVRSAAAPSSRPSGVSIPVTTVRSGSGGGVGLERQHSTAIVPRLPMEVALSRGPSEALPSATSPAPSLVRAAPTTAPTASAVNSSVAVGAARPTLSRKDEAGAPSAVRRPSGPFAAVQPFAHRMTKAQAARTIQRFWRGWRLARHAASLRSLAAVASELRAAYARFYAHMGATVANITNKQYLEVNELAMRAILKLDSMEGMPPEFRALRKHLTARALRLQDEAAAAYGASSARPALSRGPSATMPAAAAGGAALSPAASGALPAVSQALSEQPLQPAGNERRPEVEMEAGRATAVDAATAPVLSEADGTIAAQGPSSPPLPCVATCAPSASSSPSAFSAVSTISATSATVTPAGAAAGVGDARHPATSCSRTPSLSAELPSPPPSPKASSSSPLSRDPSLDALLESAASSPEAQRDPAVCSQEEGLPDGNALTLLERDGCGGAVQMVGEGSSCDAVATPGGVGVSERQASGNGSGAEQQQQQQQPGDVVVRVVIRVQEEGRPLRELVSAGTQTD